MQFVINFENWFLGSEGFNPHRELSQKKKDLKKIDTLRSKIDL